MTMADYYDTKMAADKLGVSTARIRRLRLDGRLQPCIFLSRGWVFPARVIDNFQRMVSGRPRALKLKPKKDNNREGKHEKSDV